MMYRLALVCFVAIIYFSVSSSATDRNAGSSDLLFAAETNVDDKHDVPVHRLDDTRQHSARDKHDMLQDGQNHAKVGTDGSKEDPMKAYFARRRRLNNWALNVSCDVCELVILQVQDMLKNKKDVAEIAKAVVDICIKFKIEDERVCKMIVPLFQNEVIYVIDHLVLSPEEACGILIGDSCATPYYPGEMWNVTFPNRIKPPPKPPTPPQPYAPTIRFLHLTDIHIDLMYKEGSNVKCGEPLCCRVNDNFTINPAAQKYIKAEDRAGKYGQLDHCDAPIILAEELFQHLSTIQDQFDYVIFTGDIPAHDVWNQSKTDQIEHLMTLDRLFSKYLPNKPWYSCVGNHETSPIQSFPQPGIPFHSMDWMYGAMAEVWGKWLPQSSLEEVMNCGGYSFSPYPGFRIISINDNYCNIMNWWLLLNATDPCGVLQWLVDELQSAEDKGEKVHILMHIPPGATDCLKPWSYNYYSIINRYENTVVNQFYGHTHHDSYTMFYDEATFQRPVGFAFIGPSVTPFSFINPTYRIYTMDGNYANSSWAVLDYSNYYLNLTEANQLGDLSWEYEYSPKKAYNMTGLYKADWEDLLQRMEKDDELFQLFYKHHEEMNPRSACDSSCKKSILCSVKEARSYDADLCNIHK